MIDQAGLCSTLDKKTDPTLHILLVGEGPEVETLSSKLKQSASVVNVFIVAHLHYAWGEMPSGKFNSIFLFLPAMPYDDIDRSVSTIFRMRGQFPEIVFAFIDSTSDFNKRVRKLPIDTKKRLEHYYRISRNYDDAELDQMLQNCYRWHKAIVAKRPYTSQYKYDVALSFAGEQRIYADELAEILHANGVRVFYDGFEQAELWGKNLFDHLYNIYAIECRYCIVFVSKEYSEKMWTVHERHAAQERVLRDRNSEYLLPIRVDDTKLPGLPASVGYLDVRTGIRSIATLFVRKLGGNVGRFS